MPASPSQAHSIDSRHGYAMILMLLGSVAISFGGVVQRHIEEADSWQTNVYRSLGMLLATVLILGYQYRGRALTVLAGVGGFGILAALLLTVAGIAFLQALTNTTVANALFILGAIPFFAALFARVFLGERLRRTTVLTMIGAACGLSIMLVQGMSVGFGFGIAMSLVTAISFALYAVIVRYKRQTEMLPVMLFSSLLIIVISLAVKSGDVSIPLRDIALALFWGGCLSGFVNWTFIVAARHLAAAEVTLIMLLEFSLGPLWVWIFIGETPAVATLVGGGLILVSVALRAGVEIVDKPRREQTPQSPV
ncbi:MAG: DMT family transporter [Pseudomonadota bacterium]